MKNIFFVLIAFFFSCHGQVMNKTTLDEKSGKQMLVGYCDRSAFLDTSFAGWFYTRYESTEVDFETLEQLFAVDFSNIKIKIVGGSWCSDTKQHLPSFYFILDQLNFSMEKVELIMVNRDKKTEDVEMEDFNIQFVPTFIIYKNDNEIGRIVENPQESLEKDLLKILKSNL